MSSSHSPSLKLFTGNTLLSMKDGRNVRFIKLPSMAVPAKEERAFSLPFDGWSMAVHPPTNVLAVSECPGPDLYVTSEWFPSSDNMTLKRFTHLQEGQGSYSENGHGRKPSLRYHPNLGISTPGRVLRIQG